MLHCAVWNINFDYLHQFCLRTYIFYAMLLKIYIFLGFPIFPISFNMQGYPQKSHGGPNHRVLFVCTWRNNVCYRVCKSSVSYIYVRRQSSEFTFRFLSKNNSQRKSFLYKRLSCKLCMMINSQKKVNTLLGGFYSYCILIFCTFTF